MQGSLDYKLPYDVELEVEFDVCCTRISYGECPDVKVALHDNYDWERILTLPQKCELRDEWWCYETANEKMFETVEIKLPFEVSFLSKGEIDNVSLNGIDINDIVSPEMEQALIDAVKEGRE